MSPTDKTKQTRDMRWGAGLVSFLHLTIGLLTVAGNAIAQEPSCNRDSAAVYPWICTDADARKALATIDAAIASTVVKIDPRDREIFELQQKSWEERMAVVCEDPLPGGTQARSQCIAGFTTSRLKELDKWPGRGKTVILDSSPLNQRACDAALRRERIAWQWKLRDRDNYTIIPDALGQEPTWTEISATDIFTLNKARFNFVNNETMEDVFELRSKTPSLTYTWYITAPPEEVKSVEQQLRTIRRSYDEALGDLMARLRYPDESQRDSTWNRLVYERKANKEPTLKSSLYVASNTELYKGWYTDSQVAMFEGQTFLLASSVNNSEPSVALFRPAEGGVLKPVCFHDAIPSARKPTIRILSDHFICPIGLPQQPIAWETDAYGNRRAAIDFPEWGGRRWVAEKSATPQRYSYQWLDVSAVGATQPPEENAWAPINGVAQDGGDTVSLILTDSGPYISSVSWIPEGQEDSRPVTATYFRIHDNQLTAVCEQTRTIVPPPGYAIEGSMN